MTKTLLTLYIYFCNEFLGCFWWFFFLSILIVMFPWLLCITPTPIDAMVFNPTPIEAMVYLFFFFLFWVLKRTDDRFAQRTKIFCSHVQLKRTYGGCCGLADARVADATDWRRDEDMHPIKFDVHASVDVAAWHNWKTSDCWSSQIMLSDVRRGGCCFLCN